MRTDVSADLLKDGKTCKTGRDHVVTEGVRKLRGLCGELAPCVFVEKLGAATVSVVMRGPKKSDKKAVRRKKGEAGITLSHDGRKGI